jgi:hypothetical protein
MEVISSVHNTVLDWEKFAAVKSYSSFLELFVLRIVEDSSFSHYEAVGSD